MIKHRLWCAAALAATFILAGCSHSSSPGQGRPQAWLEPGTRVTLPAPGITPPLNAQQLLTGRFHGQTQSLLVMLNADAHRLTLAGLSSVGIRLFQGFLFSRPCLNGIGEICWPIARQATDL